VKQRISALQRLGVQLEQLAEGRVERPRHRARRPLVALVAALILLGAAAAALAAGGVFSTGQPVRPGPQDLMHPHQGAGTVVPGSVGEIAALAPDPAGGPGWGMRVLRTSRGLACLQFGRVLNGRLGVLGQDGAFSDDGRFHALPAAVNSIPVGCAAPDGRGRLFQSVQIEGIPASSDPTGCTPPGDTEPHPNPPVCEQRDERAVFAGVLGPDAQSITYNIAGRSHTLSTGPAGAYLIVLQADPSRDRGGANLPGLLPAPGNGQPITQITYRNGQVCHINGITETDAYGRPCMAVGYLPRVLALPSERQVAAPVHIVLRHDVPVPGGHATRADELEVSFTARVAITQASSTYELSLRLPTTGACRGETAGTGINRDVAAGARVHLHYTLAAYPGSFLRCPGRYQGAVYYVQTPAATGHTLPPPPVAGAGAASVLVGRFAFSVK
jgi:hypothetical protein